MIPTMNDTQKTDGIVTWYLLYARPFILYLLLHIKSFDLSHVQVSECLVGPMSFDNPQGMLICYQISIPILLKIVGLILTICITPSAFLGDWILIELVHLSSRGFGPCTKWWSLFTTTFVSSWQLTFLLFGQLWVSNFNTCMTPT